MRRFPRQGRVSFRLGNVLADVSGEIEVPPHDAPRSMQAGEPLLDRFALGTEPLGIRCVADIDVERVLS